LLISTLIFSFSYASALTAGTFEDLKLKNIVLTAGMQVTLDDQEEFNILGIVEFSETENIWVAKIDWKDLD